MKKICVICEICVTKTIEAHFGRKPLASGQIPREAVRNPISKIAFRVIREIR
jgi:hypothetical protein